jgi:hypothetical protein
MNISFRAMSAPAVISIITSFIIALTAFIAHGLKLETVGATWEDSSRNVILYKCDADCALFGSLT